MKKTLLIFFLLTNGLLAYSQTIGLRGGLTTISGNIDYLNSGLFVGLEYSVPFAEPIFLSSQIDYRYNSVHIRNFTEASFPDFDPDFKLKGGYLSTLSTKIGLKFQPKDYAFGLTAGSGLAFSKMGEIDIIDLETNKKTGTFTSDEESQGKPLIYAGINTGFGPLVLDLTMTRIFKNYADLTSFDFSIIWNINL